MGLHRRRVWEIAKGFRGRARNCIKIARQQAEKALQHAYKGRKDKKGDTRSLWIQRVNAAAREHGVSQQWILPGCAVCSSCMHHCCIRVHCRLFSTVCIEDGPLCICCSCGHACQLVHQSVCKWTQHLASTRKRQQSAQRAPFLSLSMLRGSCKKIPVSCAPMFATSPKQCCRSIQQQLVSLLSPALQR
jgi:ribosomal protein L20